MPDLDHREMTPPFLREVHEMRASSYLGIWDLRISPPNVAPVPSDVMHSLEHFLNVELRGDSSAIHLVAPMGCATGLYIVSSVPDFETIAELVRDALSAILSAESVPLANDVDCGHAEHHSLSGAQRVARYLLDRCSDWSTCVITPCGTAESSSSVHG